MSSRSLVTQSVDTNQSWHHSTTWSISITPATLTTLGAIIDFVDRFITPLATILPDASVVTHQTILRAADDILHIAECLLIAVLVFLVHHIVGEEHLCESLCGMSATSFGFLHRKGFAIDNLFEHSNYLIINLVGRELLGNVRELQVFLIIRHVTPELP